MMAGEKHPRYRPRLWIITGLTTVVVLALGLGLGLGLGLKHHHDDASTSPSTEALPFLTPQTSDNFVVGTIVGQSFQDRGYNLTLALSNGAPDGVNKTMLVINGTSLHSFRE
jgi:iron transport multicopper oxidase